MTGKYILEVWDNKSHFKLELQRQITIINDNSATGKTYFCNLVRKLLSRIPTVKSNMTHKLLVLDRSSDWVRLLKENRKKIILIDEGVDYVYSSYFSELALPSDNYFILIGRNPFNNLLYSVYSIYKFKTEKKEKFITELVYKYNNTNINILPTKIVCGDSNSGYKFFKTLFNIPVGTTNGKNNISAYISNDKSSDTLYIIADGEGIGDQISKILREVKLRGNCYIYLPRSFEYLLLRYIKFYSNIKDELDNTYNYCDSLQYKSWEQYYTHLMQITALKHSFTYTKSKIHNSLITKPILQHIKTELTDIDRSVFKC